MPCACPGSARTFWAREVNSYGKTISLSKWIVDCSIKQIGALEAIQYSSDGSVISHHQIEGAVGGSDMWEFAPGTIGEGYFNFICSRTTSQPLTSPSKVSQATSEYPKAACGDSAPSTPGAYKLYPVFADYSPGTLQYILNNLCRDAIQTTREDRKTSIQVASFTNKSRAVDFASFLKKRVGSGEVGNPKTIVIR